MENTSAPIAGTISNSNPAVPLSFKILLDDVVVYTIDHVVQPAQFSFEVPDAEGNRELQFVMTGKKQEHTVIDEQGKIIKDAMLTISNVCFDGIDITQILSEHAVYTHNFNDTQAPTQDKFFGHMGCNGTVSLKFTTPVYFWLLEKM